MPELGNPLKTRQRGLKLYELKNLPITIGIGNVISVVSDRLLSTGPNSNNKVNKFEAEIVRYSDYYPFGFEIRSKAEYSRTPLKINYYREQMAGRADNSENYRYGFNGMEKDKEFTNSTSHYDFGARIYDSRLGRWLAVDAIMNQFPSFSPYCFSNNSPISFIDLEGEIPLLVINYQTKTIIIYQPVFVVTSGPGAYTQAEVKSMNNDVNSYINADQFGAEVDGEGGWTYNLTFIFYEGGTITEAEKKANESGQVFGAYIPATLEQHISITDFNNSLLRLKPNNKVNPNTAAGVCYRSTNISINKVLSRINELWVLTHELFHALFSKDNEGGITQYPMNNGGKMDKVNQKNLQDATDRALDWFSNVVIVTEEGSVINDFGIGTQDLSLLPKDIKLYDKNKAYENKRNNYGNGGSGMGALHQSQLEEEIELSF